MKKINKSESIALFLGDIFILYFSLWLMLLIRYMEIPGKDILYIHILSFSFIFIIWFLVFYIAGLYEKHTILIKNKLPITILNTQIINSLIAVLFFYLIPYFAITPKTNLLIFIIISFVLIIFWRLTIFEKLSFRKQKQPAALIGSGGELEELLFEVNNNHRYEFKFNKVIDLNKDSEIDVRSEMINAIKKDDISLFVIDIRNEKIKPILPELYKLILFDVRFIDMDEAYESIFDRIPLSTIDYDWFLENISSKQHFIYDFVKRITDIVFSITLGLISLIIYPFVIVAILIDDGNHPFIIQERVGQKNKKIKLIKFRSMKVNDDGKWPEKNDKRITSVGKFLRKTRIDEFPQLWNVLKGDISLIGPRPDMINFFKDLSEKIPYYNVRNIVKPGLSGWAQISQESPPHSVEETRDRLAYDLYYIKNKSIFLDFKISLKTIKTLISRTGK